jgi:hypothetical protein
MRLSLPVKIFWVAVKNSGKGKASCDVGEGLFALQGIIWGYRQWSGNLNAWPEQLGITIADDVKYIFCEALRQWRVTFSAITGF